MPRVEFVEGIQCKKCGNIIISPTIFTKELCQKCGAQIINMNFAKRTYAPGLYGEEITVKVTHGLFHNTLEKVD